MLAVGDKYIKTFIKNMLMLKEQQGVSLGVNIEYLTNSILKNLSCKDLFWILSEDDYNELYTDRIIRPQKITYKEARKKIKLSSKELDEILLKLKKEFDKDPQKDIMFTQTKLLTDQIFCPIRMYFKMLLTEKTTFLSTIIDRFMWGKELGVYKKDDVSSFDDVYNLLYEISYDDVKNIVDKKTEGITIDSLKDEEYFNTFVSKVNFIDFKQKQEKVISQFCRELWDLFDGDETKIPAVCKGDAYIDMKEKPAFPKRINRIIYKRPIYEFMKRLLLNPHFLIYVCPAFSDRLGFSDPYNISTEIITKINSSVKSKYLSFEADYIGIGEFVEECYALILPTIRWTFEDTRTHIFFSAVPDGIGEDFIYEFKATSSANTKKSIYEVAIKQASIYGTFFNKSKALIEVLVGSKFGKSDFLKKSFVKKYGFMIIEDAIDIHTTIDIDLSIYNASVFELQNIPNNIDLLRPISDKICENSCPYHIREKCPYYRNVYLNKNKFEEILKKMLNEEKDIYVDYIR